jgi:hypothetical protein
MSAWSMVRHQGKEVAANYPGKSSHAWANTQQYFCHHHTESRGSLVSVWEDDV